MQVGLVLKEVQMTPLLLGGVMHRGQSTADRTGELSPFLEVYVDIDPVGFLGKGNLLYFPGRDDAKGHTKELFGLHVTATSENEMTDYTTATHSFRRRAKESRQMIDKKVHKTEFQGCNTTTVLTPQDYWDSGYNNLKLEKAPLEDPVRHWIEQYVPSGDGTCLEVGAFPGRYLTVFGELGYELNGIDLTQRIESDLPIWLKNNGFKTGTFRRCNFFEYYDEQQYDIVSSFGFIEHFINWETVLAKHVPLVKDGGLLVIETPNFGGKLQKHLHLALDRENMQRHCLEAMCPERWAEICTEYGFEIIFSGYFGGFDFWTDGEELGPVLKDVMASISNVLPVLRTIKEDDPSYSPYCGLIARKKIKSTYFCNIGPYPLYPEVDKWALSSFIIEKLLPIVGVQPFPLDEQLLMASAVSFFRPDVIIEWGTNIGNSARIFHELRVHLELETVIHSIDLPPEAVHSENIKNTQSRGALVTGLPVSLHLGDGLTVAKQLIKEGSYQKPLFFVDGDHAYTSVMRELEGIRNIVGEAVILAHDTFLQRPGSGYNCGPGKAVLEFAERYNLETWSTSLGLPGMSLIRIPSTRFDSTCFLTHKHTPPPLTPKGYISILFTVEFYYPHIGGSESVIQQLAERLTQRGHKVTVATTRLPERNFSEQNGVTIREFDISGNLATGLHGADAQAYLDFLNTSQFDVVMNYACQQWATDIALLHVIQNRHPQTVYIVAPCGYSALDEDLRPFSSAYSEYFDSILPDILPLYDAVIYHSAMYKDFRYALRHGFSNSHIIPNGVGEDEFEAPVEKDFRKEFDITTRFMGLCVANYYLGKGHSRLIECVRRMNRNDFTLVCIGNQGELLTSLQQKATGLPIRFLSGVSRELTVAAFHTADIILFGSEVEASPLVIIEAKASRTPFVSTDCGNVREWKGGVVCAPEEMYRMANHILNNVHLREQLAEEGWQEWKAKLTWEAVVDQYERLYFELVEQKRAGAR